MKYKILIFFVIVLFIGGCVQTQETQEPTTTEPTTEEETTTQEEEQETPEEEKVMNDELLELLAKSGQKVNGVYYLYYGPPDAELGYKFSVVGNNIKNVLPAQVMFDSGRFYDAVYLDKEEQTAFGYCEAPGCTDKETAFTLEYDEYIRVTPFDKLNLVVYGEITGEETIENRKVKVVKFEGQNVSGKMWIDTYSGLPLKVEETTEGKTIKTEFRSISINSVMESDVMR